MSTENTSEEYGFILHKVKEITKEAGLCAAGSLLEIIKGSNLDIKTLLDDLHKDGITYVIHNIPTGQVEVLVDLRMTAAVMLATCSDMCYIAGSGVRSHITKMLDNLYRNENKGMSIQSSVLKDVFDRYLDTLTVGSENKKCKIDEVQTDLYYQRTAAALNTLMKNDQDLTAVYKLAVTTFSIVNNPLLGEGSLKGMRLKNPEPNSTYNHFHRLACVLVNRYK